MTRFFFAPALLVLGCHREPKRSEPARGFDLAVPAGWKVLERTPFGAKLEGQSSSLVIESFEIPDFQSLEKTTSNVSSLVRKSGVTVERELFDDTVAGDAAKGFAFRREDGVAVCSRVVHHGGKHVSSVQCFASADPCAACAAPLRSLTWVKGQ